MDLSNHSPFGLKQSNLKKAFKRCLRSMIESGSEQEFHNAFSTFSHSERDILYGIFLHYVNSLKDTIEVEFDSICQETQVSTILDRVEELVEEQSFNCFIKDKTHLENVKEEELRVKKNEVQYLTDMLEKIEECNRVMRARIELLKKVRQDTSSTSDVIGKLRIWNSEYDRTL